MEKMKFEKLQPILDDLLVVLKNGVPRLKKGEIPENVLISTNLWIDDMIVRINKDLQTNYIEPPRDFFWAIIREFHYLLGSKYKGCFTNYEKDEMLKALITFYFSSPNAFGEIR